MEKHPVNIQFNDASIHGVVFERTHLSNGRRLVLLHGAGVPGELTWTFIANYLSQWQEILIIDFPNMGLSRWKTDKHLPHLKDYSYLIRDVLRSLDWQTVDIAGYSFGGLVAASLVDPRLLHADDEVTDLIQDDTSLQIKKLFLIEPAMLFSETAADLRKRGAEYMDLAMKIIDSPDNEEAYLFFLDAVSPKRIKNSDSDRLTLDRLKNNAEGFAQAIYSVSRELSAQAEYLAHWVSPVTGSSFVGELSVPSMHHRHARLRADMSKQPNKWDVHTIPNADHSLVFTRPRMIAKAMNAAYLSKTN